MQHEMILIKNINIWDMPAFYKNISIATTHTGHNRLRPTKTSEGWILLEFSIVLCTRMPRKVKLKCFFTAERRKFVI